MILIVSATRTKYEDLKATSLSCSLPATNDFIKCIINNTYCAISSVNKQVDILYIYENTLPIAKAYNVGISYALSETVYTEIVFIHDDVTIEDRRFEHKVGYWLSKYDVIGLAGGDNVKLEKPYLWHIMSKNRYGTVGHYIDGDWYGTSFGVTNKRVTIIDGLFIGIKTNTLREKNNLRFDEDLPGFHHYDIDFSLQANKQKCKIGVVPILVTHNSPGLLSFNKDYIESENYLHRKCSANSLP